MEVIEGYDMGLKAVAQRVLVKRINSDWHSAQWQLEDLRSVEPVSVNQALRLFFSPSLGSNFSFCSQSLTGRGALFSFVVRLSISLCISIFSPLSALLSHCTCSLTAPPINQHSVHSSSLLKSKLRKRGRFSCIVNVVAFF